MRFVYVALTAFSIFAISASSKARVKPVAEQCCGGGGGDTAVGKKVLEKGLQASPSQLESR